MLTFLRIHRPTINMLTRVDRVIDRYEGKALNSRTLIEIQKDVNALFDRSLRKLGERWNVFEGLEVIGASVYAMDGVVAFKWVTSFNPSQRFSGQHGRAHVLGIYGKYDLYVIRQGHIEPVLIARYGEATSDYIAGVPRELDVDSLASDESPLVEACRRARALGMLGNTRPTALELAIITA